MLQNLFIKDLGVVALADIGFFNGMTVITGETGAGKSILLDALALALGERSDSQFIRPGAERAEIAATFDISGLPGAILWLTDCELTGDSPQHCLIRRIIHTNGRSRAFINGCPVTTQQLRLLGEHLVQIHGQHQHQLLLKTAEQLRLLDAFGQHDEIVSQVKTAFKAWEKLQARRLDVVSSLQTIDSQRDLLQYQLSELEGLQLTEKELALLYQEHDQLAHAQSYIQSSELALSYLENEEDGNVLSLLTKATLCLRPLVTKSPELSAANELLESARIQLEESISEVNNFVNHLEINPTRLSEIDRRLEHIHDVARKHKVDPSQLYEHYQYLKLKAQQFSQLEETLQKIDHDLQLAKEHYGRFAVALSNARQKSATQLANDVTQYIQQLGMPGAVFTVSLIAHDDKILHSSGNESVIFGISANPGHPPQPLNKVASGGELSRISLALELITTKYLATPCLIFDEVDVGISGKIGALVGKALFELGRVAQVLCITHLPQVAAFGDHHLQVTKTRLENSTHTDIMPLTESERINEIARMLGGIDITPQARAHAKQLLKHKEESSVVV